MTWFKVDDSFHAHPKLMALSFGARGLWVTAGSWSAHYLTDGVVKSHVTAAWRVEDTLIGELVESGLWEPIEGGWRFHDWQKYQPSKAEILAKRAATTERKRKSRETATAVTRDLPTVYSGHTSPDPVPSRPKEDLNRLRAANDSSDDCAHEAYRWLTETLGTIPADLGSWRREYAAIGAKPASERLQVATAIKGTTWLMDKPSRATPRHVLKHWQSFLEEGPRNFELKPPVVALDFKSQREAAQKAYTKSRLDKYDAEMTAYINLAKTEADRRERVDEWQQNRLRLDRSLP
jgi:hypothetical protein